MGLLLAVKSFFRAIKDPEGAKRFINGKVEERNRLLETKTSEKREKKGETSHLQLLALLQRSGRLLDFLQEDIAGYDDDQIGAAVRVVHRECSGCLEELLALRPVMAEEEGTEVTVPKGYDIATIKVVGEVRGEPPYKGVVVHRGWRVSRRTLPRSSVEQGDVVAPAEIEVK